MLIFLNVIPYIIFKRDYKSFHRIWNIPRGFVGFQKISKWLLIFKDFKRFKGIFEVCISWLFFSVSKISGNFKEFRSVVKISGNFWYLQWVVNISRNFKTLKCILIYLRGFKIILWDLKYFTKLIMFVRSW